MDTASTGQHRIGAGRGAPDSDRCPLVAPGFWDAASIRAALNDRHMGKVIAAYRAHPAHPRPISQAQMGRWVGITQGQLSRIENGPPIKYLDRLVQWATLLTIPADLLWFQLPGQASRAVPATIPATTPAAGPFRLVRITDAAGDEDPDLAAVRAFRSADQSLGGGHLYTAVIDYLHTDIAPRLFGGDQRGDARSLFTAAAGLTEMAGWMAHDAGHNRQADQHFRRALDLAVVGRDHHLHVHVLASLSHLSLHRRKPDAALGYAHDAEMALSRAGRNPELTARIYALQARAHAAQHQPGHAHRLLDQAARTLVAPAEPVTSPWASHFDQASLASDAARCLRTVGDLPGAARNAHRIIGLRPVGTRSHAFAQLTLAAILTAQGHPDHACVVATKVLDSISAMNSHQLTLQLHGLDHQLRPYLTNRLVGQFVDRLTAVIHERASMHRTAAIT
ncbi:hypothetical protein [Nocardia fluminea]|uniref:hypothetical protein n=1 Tax=Nocardia fluminea TaxID=134984 RepID=UPI003668F440